MRMCSIRPIRMMKILNEYDVLLILLIQEPAPRAIKQGSSTKRTELEVCIAITSNLHIFGNVSMYIILFNVKWVAKPLQGSSALAAKMAAISLAGNYRIEVNDGSNNGGGGYYLGHSPDGKRITGFGTRYYTEGGNKGHRYEGDLIDDTRHGNGNPHTHQ